MPTRPVEAPADQHKRAMTGKSRKYMLWGYLGATLMVAALCKVYGFQPSALLPGADGFEQSISWSDALSMSAFIAAFASAVFLSVPIAPVFCIASGYFFGAVEGTAMASLATTVGSVAAFHFFRKTVAAPAAFRQLEIKNLFLVLLLLRCSPWFPSPLINLYCGASRVRSPMFLFSTLFGALPLICVYTLAASRLRGELDMSLLYSPEIIGVLIVLSLISLIGLLLPFRVFSNYLHALGQGA